MAIFFVQRGEYQTANERPQAINVMGEELVLDEQAALGQPVNIKSAQSSPLTTGAGDKVYNSLFVDTRNPNTLPSPSPTV